MVCEYLRSCYSTAAVLSPGQEPTTLRWYWAAEDAKLLPHWSAVTSHNWIDAAERPGNPIGEVAGAARPWRNGSIAGRPPGQDFHGHPGWYLDGSPPGETLTRSPSGIPAECFAPVVGQGGAGIGGTQLVYRETPRSSSFGFPPDVPFDLRLRLVDGTGVWEGMTQEVRLRRLPFGPGEPREGSYFILNHEGFPKPNSLIGTFTLGEAGTPENPLPYFALRWQGSRSGVGEGFKQLVGSPSGFAFERPFEFVFPITAINNGGQVIGTATAIVDDGPY